MGIGVCVAAVVAVWSASAFAEPLEANERRGEDYLAAREDLIRAEQHCEKGAGSDWAEFVATLEACREFLDSSVEKSQAYRDYLRRAKDPESCSVADAIFAVTGEVEDVELRAEGEKLLARFEASDLPARVDRLSAPGRCYVPPRWTKLLVRGDSRWVGNLRALGRVDRARILLAIRDGDEKRLRDAIRQSMLVARVACFEGDSVPAMVADAVRIMAVRPLIDSGPLPPGFAAAALDELGRSTAPRWEFTFGCERLTAMYDLDLAFGQVADKLHQSPVWYERAFGYLIIGSRAEQFQLVDWVYGGLLATFETDVAKANLARDRSSRAFRLCEGRWTGFRYQLALLMLPNAYALGRSARVGRMEVEGGAATLALLAFREAEGRLPATLDDLTPRYLPAVPADWYGPTPGLAPLKYRILDPATDPAGRSFLLYSVGGDGVDDGGKDPAGLPGDAMTPPGRGTDYVISKRHEGKKQAALGERR